MSGHTPGPWFADLANAPEIWITAAQPAWRGHPAGIRPIPCDMRQESGEANARLIAESPALLAFAKWAIGQLCGDSGTGESHWEQFQEFREGKSAIAKAEGKP